MTWTCDFCNCKGITPNAECPSCALYSAAVEAQRCAANRIAKDFSPHARDAWLNEHGVFAWVRGKARQVASASAAAPFAALTTAARAVKCDDMATLPQPAHGGSETEPK